MYWRWWKNEIICTLLWINQRYFSSKKRFSRNFYCLHAGSWFKSFILFNLFYLRFCFRHRKFQLQDLWSCALVCWCQKHHLTSHTPYFLNTLLTTFLFTQPSHSTPSWSKNDLRLLGFLPVYQHALSFPVRSSQWGIENFYIVFPYSLKERVKQGYFSGCLKMHKMLLSK